jgi:subtilisin family serine protease
MQAGVFVAIAAGNDNANACDYSPARVVDAVTVAAAENGPFGSMGKAGFSNYGSCIDIYGPGSNIRSARLGGGAATMSGTSMATPHVTGAAAIYKSTNGDAAQSIIASWLVTNATAGLINGNPAGTPNLLVYKAPAF